MSEAIPFRVGEWLPSDQAILEKWLEDLSAEAKNRAEPLHPKIAAFSHFIEHDAAVYMLFHQMFDQIPHKHPYNKNPVGAPQVRNYEHMLNMLNAIMTKAPHFGTNGLVILPINGILDWSMGTSGGNAAFLNEDVNRHLKDILNAWGEFLQSEASCYVLNTDAETGWFGAAARKAMPHFEEEFVCDPTKPHHGFTSWDNFFTRELRKGVRPIAALDDDAVIVNACESAPYRLAQEVKKRDRFWIKAQPYSMEHMLDNNEFVDDFVGGTVYQAFLSALSYHRWHSPVSGKVVRAYVIDGTYFSEATAEGFDPEAPSHSQGYITEVATRALIFIEADNPDIGLMCFMGVGMGDVSSCEITIKEGQHIKKGSQIGMFHFGGSTHCLIFRPHVKLEFDLHGQTPGIGTSNIPINSVIARVDNSAKPASQTSKTPAR